MVVVSAERVLFCNALAAAGFVPVYCTWHFRWHLFHLGVTLHDINSDSAARIDIAVLFWETRGRTDMSDRLISVACPLLSRSTWSKIRLQLSDVRSDMCADEAATFV